MAEELGFMLYGFDKDEAETVNEFMQVLAQREVKGISATGKMNKKVADILSQAKFDQFESAEPKVLMFLGFQDNQIGAAMKYFPKDLGRPIFCSLTEQNVHWTLEYLIEHLLEERAAMARKP